MEMDIFTTILFMVVVGAIVAGSTNYLAIKMLFRPYHAVYIGKWRLPFTPGIIPKRRDELANQLGKMVVKHLLTPESIQKKFLNDNFQKEMTNLAQKELDKLLSSEESLVAFFGKMGFEDSVGKIEGQLEGLLEKKYEQLMDKYRHKPIKFILTEELVEKIDSKIPQVSGYILQKGTDYFSSLEGELRIERLVDDFIKQRSGMLGNMMQMFLGNVNLKGLIQKELLKFLGSEGTKDLVTVLLRKEYEKVLEWHAEKLEEQFGREQLLKTIKQTVGRLISVERILATPVSELTQSYRERLIDNLAPQAVLFLSGWLGSRIEDLMERLHLAELIREQVETFSVERIEEIVLMITSRELNMITYFGAIIGAVIGLLQGIIVLLMG